MEKEVAEGANVTIALVSIAALIGIIVFTVYIGGVIREDSGEVLTDIRDEMSVDFIYRLSAGGVDNEMPAATAYNILKTYDKIITEVACGFDGEVSHIMTEDPCVGNRLTGRVQLEVIEVDGAYLAFIHEEDCNWHVGDETCSVQSGFNELKSKYGL